MYTFFFFILGAIIGSFAQVVVLRLYANEKGIFWGQSHSQFDQRNLKWYELIPILSFVLQKGRDRATGKPISRYYLLSELLFGFGFALLAFFSDYNVDFVLHLVLFSFWATLALYDSRFGVVDRRISLPFILLLLVLTFFKENPTHFYLAGGLGGLWFALPHIISKGKWVGQGDIDLGVAFGLNVGLYSLWPLGFLAYLAASLFIGLQKIQKKPITQLPMAPFLFLGVFCYLLFANQLAEMYFSATLG